MTFLSKSINTLFHNATPSPLSQWHWLWRAKYRSSFTEGFTSQSIKKKKVWGASVVNLKFLLRSVFKVLRAAFTITAAVLGKFTTYLLLYFDLCSASILLYFPLWEGDFLLMNFFSTSYYLLILSKVRTDTEWKKENLPKLEEHG